jgi:hypothetical protein
MIILFGLDDDDDDNNNNNYYYYYIAGLDNHHHMCVMELGHLLIRSGLTYPEVLQRYAMILSASWGIVFHYPA